MNRLDFFNEAKEISFELSGRNVNGADLRIQYPRGSKPQWRDELNRLIHLRDEADSVDAQIEELIPLAPPPGPRVELEPGRERRLSVQEQASLKARELKRWNVTIDAVYDFGPPYHAILDNVFIQFTVDAVSRMEVRSRINELRQKWEEDNGALINGKTNWVFKDYTTIEIVQVTESILADVPMFATKWHYKLLGDIDKININKGKCVTDYLLYEFSKHKKEFSWMTEKYIHLIMGKKKGYTTNDIMNLAKTSKYISVHALTPILEVFLHHRAVEHTRVNLCFIVNNEHCYPIIDKIFKNKIIYNNKLDLGDFEFEIEYDKHTYFSTESEYLHNKKKTEKIILIDTRNLSWLAYEVMKRTGKIIQGMKFYYSVLTSFEHPDGSIIEVAPDYTLRREVCQMLHKRNPITEFVYRNQTWASLAKNIFKYQFDDLKQSILSEEMINIYDKYSIGPYTKIVNDMSCVFDSDIHGAFDRTKCYTDVLLNNEYELPVYTVFDEIRPIEDISNVTKRTIEGVEKIRVNSIDWVVGEYYINKQLKLGNGTIVYPKGFYPQNLTRWCVEKKYIELSDIKFYAKAGTCLAPDHFKPFIEYCLNIQLLKEEVEPEPELIYQEPNPEDGYVGVIQQEECNRFFKELMEKKKKEEKKEEDNWAQQFQRSISKSLINNFIGWLNKKWTIKEKGAITDSFPVACGTFAEEIKKGNECFINKIKDLYIIRSTKKERLSRTSSPIWRHIIAGGIISLDKMHSEVCDENSKVISYKVDAIFVENPRKDFVPATDENKKIGDITIENWSISGTKISIDTKEKYKIKKTEWIKKKYDHSEEMYKELQEGSYGCFGMSGSSKSTTLSRLCKDAIKAGKKIKILCQTNKAVAVLKRKGVKDVQTFDSIFWNKNTGLRDERLGERILKNYDGIWVDEFSMPCWTLYSVLLPLKKAGKEIRLFGDNNQCSAIEEHGPKKMEYFDEESGEMIKDKTAYKMYDYESSTYIKMLCDCRYYKMKYISKYGRYDNKLYKVIKYLMKTGKISKECINKKNKKCYSNICYTNRKRWEINKERYDDYKLMRMKDLDIVDVNNPKHYQKGYVPISYTIKKKQCGKKMQNMNWTKDNNESVYTQTWMKGVSVICNINSKEKDVYCGERYYIDEVNRKKKQITLLTIDGEKVDAVFDYYYFSYNFEIGFCITVHRIQGDEIKNKFCIYQVEYMSFELFYTAIGRAREFDKVFFNYTPKQFQREVVCNRSTIIKHKVKIPDMRQNKGGEREHQEKREPKIQIVQDVHLNKKIFEIREQKDMYIIQYRENGKKKNRKVRFGKKTTKEQALKRIMNIKAKLEE